MPGPAPAPAPATRAVAVKVLFGSSVGSDAPAPELLSVALRADGSDTVAEVKRRVAAAAGGRLRAEDLLLSFGPNDRRIGRQYAGDPEADEAALTLAQFSALAWLERFPHWALTARLLPAAPPPPGVAIQRAAAAAEGKDAERAVQDARGRGDIPKISDLPAPWGPKPYAPPAEEERRRAGALPARYPAASSPAVYA